MHTCKTVIFRLADNAGGTVVCLYSFFKLPLLVLPSLVAWHSAFNSAISWERFYLFLKLQGHCLLLNQYLLVVGYQSKKLFYLPRHLSKGKSGCGAREGLIGASWTNKCMSPWWRLLCLRETGLRFDHQPFSDRSTCSLECHDSDL